MDHLDKERLRGRARAQGGTATWCLRRRWDPEVMGTLLQEVGDTGVRVSALPWGFSKDRSVLCF